MRSRVTPGVMEEKALISVGVLHQQLARLLGLALVPQHDGLAVHGRA